MDVRRRARRLQRLPRRPPVRRPERRRARRLAARPHARHGRAGPRDDRRRGHRGRGARRARGHEDGAHGRGAGRRGRRSAPRRAQRSGGDPPGSRRRRGVRGEHVVSGPSVVDSVADTATGTTVDALFRRAFRVFADRIAVTSDQPGEAPWTYRELGERTDRLAAGLHASGLRRGDRLAVLSETRPEYVELYTAAARLGVVLITLNVRLHPDELAEIVGSAAPAALVTSGALAANAEAIRERAPSVTAWYCLDERPGFSELPRPDRPPPPPATQPTDLHVVLYPSGTTGPPKGAMITQQAAAIRGLRLAQWFGLTPDDGFIGWLP